MLCDLNVMNEAGVLCGTVSVPWNDVRAIGKNKDKPYVRTDDGSVLFVTNDHAALIAEWEQWLQLSWAAEYPNAERMT